MSTSQNLSAFVDYCQQHIRGDEKSEAQTFLTRFFQAFGHEGIKEAGAEFEDRLAKASQKGKMGYADLIWRSRPGVPGVLIEMKSRKEDLSQHYAQVERYWMRIAPNRPRYAMLCNFDEFWIFDFENQVDEPVDRILLTQLPERAGALTFMEIGGRKPVFHNNQVDVTERSARRMGEFYQAVYERGRRQGFSEFSEEQLQQLTLQCVMAMFAEDRALLPRDLFVGLIQDCMAGQGSAFDLLGGLFEQMNRQGVTPAGRYQGVEYFNGGLFAKVHPIDLTGKELEILDVCARDDWSNVRPSIFGNIFEGAIDPSKRHAHGIHFTSEVDIRQIVRPTISDYWEERIEDASTIAELNVLQLELQAYRVLDPACGSGNFLYVAYQELKRIERLLLQKIQDRRRGESGQMAIGFVTPMQFFGMDTNEFAVQLARVTMMIARKIAIDKYGLSEPALPLDTLDSNIVCRDALFGEWAAADAVIGNPPFLGGSRMRRELGDQYVERVFNQFSEVVDQVDFCSYWFRLSHEHISGSGRAGLVGTNSVSQGRSRVAALDYIVQNGGYIHEAISTQDWSGEANVDVSIVNWSKEKPHKLHLDAQEVPRINSSLRASIDVTQSIRLEANLNKCFEGVKPGGKGFFVTEKQVKEWIKVDQKNVEVLKLLLDTTSLAKRPNGKPSRWIVDFGNMLLEEASDYELPFDHIKVSVKPVRDLNRRDTRRLNWWRYSEVAPAMRNAIGLHSIYFSIPAHSKWCIPLPTPLDWIPNNSVKVVGSDDFYILGILTSTVHRCWLLERKSTLEDRIRYTHTTCFETFPFPQTPTPKQIAAIRTAAQALHTYRTEQMEKKQWGITTLYNKFFNEPSSQLHKLHAQLNDFVLSAYGFKPTDDLLEKLLTLNLELAAQEQQGLPVIGPWAIDGK